MSNVKLELEPLEALTLQSILEAFIQAEIKASAKDLGFMDVMKTLRVGTCNEVCDQISDQHDIIDNADVEQDMADYNKAFRESGERQAEEN